LRQIARIAFIVLLLTLLTNSGAFGAGFAVYNFSARGNALGGAMIGRADDPSTLATNPAGMTQIPGTGFMTTIGFLMPGGTVIENASGIAVNQRDKTFVLPSMYYTRQMNENTWLGIALMTRFGLGTDFPADWFGRYNSYRAMLQSISVNPNIAWKVNDALSVSLGVEALWMEADLRRKVDLTRGQAPNPATDMDLRLLGDDIGYGWNLGLHYTVDEATRIGLHYRSRINMALSGTATAATPLASDSAGANVDITLPEMFMFGISRQLSPKLNVEAGAIYTGWKTYDSVTINFDKPLFGVLPTRSFTEKNWSSVWRYQLGFEYQHTPEWTWRFGYTYDQEPIPLAHIDYQAPSDDRHLLSIGFGYTKNDRSWDFAYTYLVSGERSISARPGEGVLDSRTRNMDVNIFMLSYSVRF